MKFPNCPLNLFLWREKIYKAMRWEFRKMSRKVRQIVTATKRGFTRVMILYLWLSVNWSFKYNDRNSITGTLCVMARFMSQLAKWYTFDGHNPFFLLSYCHYTTMQHYTRRHGDCKFISLKHFNDTECFHFMASDSSPTDQRLITSAEIELPMRFISIAMSRTYAK